MGWLKRLLEDADNSKPDVCVDCGADISIPINRCVGRSRCSDCDAVASLIAQPKPKQQVTTGHNPRCRARSAKTCRCPGKRRRR